MNKYKQVIPLGYVVLLLGALVVFIPDKGAVALRYSMSNIATAARIIIPVYLIIALVDVWIPRETFIRWMGEDSGALAFFFAFLMGSIGAGPLHVAFPLAALLARLHPRPVRQEISILRGCPTRQLS